MSWERRREEKREGGREGKRREGWTDGGVGPQRRVIHHTTMQSALVQPLFLCRSFSLLFRPVRHLFSLFHFIYSFILSYPDPSIAVRLLDNFSMFLIFPSLLPLDCCQLLNNLSLFFFPPSFLPPFPFGDRF